ncbi:polyprenol phosphomannose-dependent alpha 1,6 mannosyltransferase MptB [Amycolatopsis sp. NPDC048633]|uniref:polyprenol phosphomannose-dependent alpha 1,6 mannosyltransferase MptB n=1 Tax=Amycolatopsis sp. NPDC048633 TaxID=3157095 RepID=UPI003401479C
MIFAGKSATAWGTAGSVLVSLGAFGAGATPRDPVLSGAWQAGYGRVFATAVLYLGLALVLAAWVRLGQSGDAREVVRAAWLWCVPLLCAPPLFSTDLYTYLAQGAVAHAGLDPYTHVPGELPGVLTENAAGGWMSVPSPYGPLQILIVKAVVAVTGENVVLGAFLTRLTMVAGLALLCFALPVLCRHLGARPERALWMTVANPLTVLCVVSGGHNDLLMVGLLAAGTALVLTGAPELGFASVALAAAVKAPAAVALPFLVWVWAAHRPGARGFFAVFAASVSIVVTTFGLCTVVAGVDLGWIRALSGNAVLEPWLSIPTALGKLGGVVLPGPVVATCRLAGWVVLAGLVTWLWWRSRAGGAAAVRGAAVALFATVVLAPVALPWYFTWPLVLGAAVAWPASRVAVAAAVSTWLVVSTHPDGKSLLPPWGFGVLAVVSAGVGVLTALSRKSDHPVRSVSAGVSCQLNRMRKRSSDGEPASAV